MGKKRQAGAIVYDCGVRRMHPVAVEEMNGDGLVPKSAKLPPVGPFVDTELELRLRWLD